ncbi:MAG: tRNA (N(6)-L-threonylcarbamoyladenosine(37)-C(2))-methylthiotransferase MtaB [Ignavibacteriaceae bacterium]|nr:tRNA (N(6)-L-threonylcarbamoyladenosine(37)-C(2))-methylthiotransferase MtaB [Ignavibacteriaceae bacterium]
MSGKVALHTLGCKLNFSESSTIGNQFIQNGFEIVDFNDKADVYVFNSCTVTENAEKDCRQLVRKALRINPDAFVIVTGCYAQLRPEEIASIKGVDLVLGSNEKFKLFSLINDFQKQELACIFVSPTEELNDFGFASSSDADSRTRAYFKIQDGCDYKCSFCTIPLARGLSRSLHPDKAVKEFRAILDKGYKEIILTGVNVGDYGKNINTDLYNLLKKLIEIPGEFRIRISSIEPNLLSDNIIDLTADSEKLCRHFHIPLQSGSNKILKLMQRRYQSQDYQLLIEKLNSRIPQLGIGVDVIVGFPGETEEDFLTTHNFLRNLEISYLHVFTYSERPDTKAIHLEGSVNFSERKRRNNILRILSEKKRNQFYRNMIGKDAEVLFESENISGMMRGFTSNYIRVEHPYSENLVNKFTGIKVEDVSGENICKVKLVEIKNSFA